MYRCVVKESSRHRGIFDGFEIQIIVPDIGCVALILEAGLTEVDVFLIVIHQDYNPDPVLDLSGISTVTTSQFNDMLQIKLPEKFHKSRQPSPENPDCGFDVVITLALFPAACDDRYFDQTLFLLLVHI